MINLTLHSQDVVPYKRLDISFETMLQSQINIRGVNTFLSESNYGKLKPEQFSVSPSIGLLFKYKLNTLWSITSGFKISQYKTKLKFDYSDGVNNTDFSVKLNRNMIEIPLIFKRTLTKKINVGVGLEFNIDEPGAIQFGSNSYTNSSNGLITSYYYNFGDTYKSLGFLIQGDYKLSKIFTLRASCNLETQNKKAFDVAYNINYDNNNFNYYYQYKPYTIRYSLGIEIRAFSFLKK